MRVALDTNILVYAEGVNGPVHQQAATALLDSLLTTELVIPVQALGELVHVLARKTRRSRAAIGDAVLIWRDGYEIAPTTIESLVSANDLIADHQLATWDAIIVAGAVEARCTLLLSEDMQDGFTWRGLVIANPFADPLHPVLARLRYES